MVQQRCYCQGTGIGKKVDMVKSQILKAKKKQENIERHRLHQGTVQ